MKKEDIKKVVLAYSGGLDTSVIIITTTAKLSLPALTLAKATNWNQFMTKH